MKRREFIKNTAIISAAAVSSASLLKAGDVRADEDEPPRRLQDPGKPTALEKKHVPLVEAPNSVKKNQWFEVKIKVGYMTPHPSTAGHWIDEIKLLVNGKEVSETENSAGGTTSPDGYFKIRLQAPAEIEAVAHCNLHGAWASTPVKIAVKA